MVATKLILPDVEPESCIVLDGISWSTYTRLLRESSHRRLRMTYDAGVLEIMTLSYEHESASGLLSQMVRALAIASGINYASGGSTTFRRKDLEKGVEPDQCFWLANAERVRGKKRINIKKDPPPDLAIEVDISRSSLSRSKIYAAFRVPEVWRFDGAKFWVLTLGKGKIYRPSPRSLAFPKFPLEVAQEFLDRLDDELEGFLVEEFRGMIKQFVD
jgi:Uma2 family endonuclease